VSGKQNQVALENRLPTHEITKKGLESNRTTVKANLQHLSRNESGILDEFRTWDAHQLDVFYNAKLENNLAEFRDAIR
jgi:hypothetical protein